MSEELEAEDDVFLNEGVLYCVCGQPIEADDVKGLIAQEGDREFVSCPTCDMKYYADGGTFKLDE